MVGEPPFDVKEAEEKAAADKCQMSSPMLNRPCTLQRLHEGAHVWDEK
jgi:hypothetical protein